MTRINTIDVKHLCDQHAQAEYRELPMVMGSLKRSLKSKTPEEILPNIPPNYTLNKGHVTFHYNKGLYLQRRYNELIEELKDRGYDIDPKSRNITGFDIFPELFQNEWWPNVADHQVNIERIILRIADKPQWYKMHGETIDFDAYQKLLSHHYS